MFGLGPMELTIILIIILIIFGAGRLPEIGSGIGKGIRNFKKSVSDTENGKIDDDKNDDKKDDA
jgi:sec-independent protein translocase protein TatA